MQNKKLLLITFTAIFMLSLSIMGVAAGEIDAQGGPGGNAGAVVITKNAADEITTSFIVGETVTIQLVGVTGNGVHTITVTYYATEGSTGQLVETYRDVRNNDELPFDPQFVGSYYVEVVDGNGQGHHFVASSTFFVVPETALGSLMALSAGLAVFGLIKLKRRTD